MIQLRWLVYEEEEVARSDVYGTWFGKPVEKIKVTKKKLQYRQQYDSTAYAGLSPFPDAFKKMTWSEWTDVPEIRDNR